MKTAYILFTYLTIFSMGMIENSRGPVYPEILKAFKIDQGLGSYIFAVSSLSAFIITLFSKSWLNKLGAFKSQKLSLIFYFVACLLMGLAPKTATGFYLFLSASVMFGMAVGMNSLTFNLIINHSTPENKRRQIFSGLHAMYGVASLLAPFAVSLLFYFNVDWQKSFLFIGFLPLCIFLYSFKLSSKGIKSPPIGELTVPKIEIYTSGIMLGLYIAGEVVLSSRLVIYLNSVHNMKLANASGQLSLFFVFLLSGRLLFAFRHFNTTSYSLLRLSLIGAILSMLGGILVWTPLLALSALFMSIFFPCVLDVFTKKYQNEIEAFMAQIMIISGGILVVLHWGFGKIASEVGLHWAIWMSPLILLISLYLLHFKGKFLSEHD